MKARKNVVLIDYENVQNVDLKPLLSHDVLIKVFHGSNQKFTSVFLNLAVEFGKGKFEAIQISGNGKNALDFHIAYYIGKLSKEIENPHFHIISKDTGFKPLVDHINNHDNVVCTLESSIAHIPQLKPTATKPIVDRYQLVVETLTKSKTPKPKRKKNLRNQVMTICKKGLSESEADKIIMKLVENKLIEINGESIIYKMGSAEK